VAGIFLGVKGGQQERKVDNLMAVWKPRRLTTQWASTVCYRDTHLLSIDWGEVLTGVLVSAGQHVST
jgi:hypothetical protein